MFQYIISFIPGRIKGARPIRPIMPSLQDPLFVRYLVLIYLTLRCRGAIRHNEKRLAELIATFFEIRTASESEPELVHELENLEAGLLDIVRHIEKDGKNLKLLNANLAAIEETVPPPSSAPCNAESQSSVRSNTGQSRRMVLDSCTQDGMLRTLIEDGGFAGVMAPTKTHTSVSASASAAEDEDEDEDDDDMYGSYSEDE